MNDLSAQTVAVRAVRGSLYNVGVSSVTLVLGFARSILLARLLLPEHFGVVALAMFYVALVSQLQSFGFDQALIHLQRDDEAARRTYLVIRMGTAMAGLVLLAVLAPVLGRLYPAMPALGWAIVALGGINIGTTLVYVHETLLRRELAFRELALTDLATSLVMTVCAPLLAWWGWGIWALVMEQASGMVTRLVMNWVAYRRWTPRLGWDAAVARRLWDYGKHLWTAGNLIFLNDRFDDFWVGSSLGQAALGFYSRAYEFAHYPRRVVVNPLINVLMPTFAHLQDDRMRMSQAFFRAAYVILRANILVSVAFGLVIPEFVALIIGPQWTPVIGAFRLMVIYALLDAMILVGQALVQAVGQPRLMATAVAVQVVVFIPAVIAGGWWWGINGVALAADIMMLIGVLVLYRGARRLVDFSISRLVVWPIVAAGAGTIAAITIEVYAPFGDEWLTAAAKMLAFGAVYLAILVATERRQYDQAVRWLWGLIRSQDANRTAGRGTSLP